MSQITFNDVHRVLNKWCRAGHIAEEHLIPIVREIVALSEDADPAFPAVVNRSSGRPIPERSPQCTCHMPVWVKNPKLHTEACGIHINRVVEEIFDMNRDQGF